MEPEIENPMNYESDDSDEQQIESAIQQQKIETMALNDTWGTKKVNFFGRNKSDDEGTDTDDDQDEKNEAERLQQIKAKKMRKFIEEQE